MNEKRSYVDDQRFIYMAEVSSADRRTFVAVHWSGFNITPDDSFIAPLRKFIAPRCPERGVVRLS